MITAPALSGAFPLEKMMEEIISFISDNWLQWLFAGAVSVLAYLYRNISTRLEIERQKNEAIAAGVQSLLRESIVSSYNKYSEKGYCPIFAKESLKKLYASYHNLGGNDVATELYNKILRMPEDGNDEK